MNKAQEAVIKAAKKWWKSHRPVGMSEADHCAYPDINTALSHKHLAKAVANLVAGKRPKPKKKK